MANDLLDSDEHYGAVFERLTLTDQSLAGFRLEDCTFRNCHGLGLDLSRAHVVGCRFETCDLSNAQVRMARLHETSFVGCKLLGLQWVHADDLRNPSFESCNLSLNNFTALRLKKTRLVQCNLREADFAQADLSESDFRGADLAGARFHQTTLLKADFRDAQGYIINPMDNKLKGAKFSMPEALGLLSGFGVVITA